MTLVLPAMVRRELYEELPSTQDRALALARAGAEEGTRVVARSQSRGRGRSDHRWSSPRGGLYLSVVLRPAGPPLPLFPLAFGAEVAVELARTYGASVRLKWPNDLVAFGPDQRARKLAGILVDAVAGPSGARAVVAGIGVNVRLAEGELADEVRASAVSLEELVGRPVPLDGLETRMVDAAVRARRALAEPRAGSTVVERCRRLLFGVGEPVLVDGRSAGRIVGLADDGALLVGTNGLVHAVVAGDVRVGSFG